MRARPWIATVFSTSALLASSHVASGYCRTTACPLPANFSPSTQSCYPSDFDIRCASLSPPVRPLVVWWRNACISYDIQQKASVQVPYATAASAIALAFSRWTETVCTNGSPVSIQVHDLGPVQCNQVQYSSDQGNQHVIIFHDDVWPHNDSSNTLGLTTVTFDPDTGEIYDADMEINSTPSVPLSIADPVPQDGYDFLSIVTHEAGHFLGMAHSGNPSATMFAHYTPGETSMRTLTDDDKEGICVIYPSDGTRIVDPSVQSGVVPEGPCDPSPRHGFQSTCAVPQSHGCATMGPSPDSGLQLAAALAAIVGAAGWRRRRARRPGVRRT